MIWKALGRCRLSRRTQQKADSQVYSAPRQTHVPAQSHLPRLPLPRPSPDTLLLSRHTPCHPHPRPTLNPPQTTPKHFLTSHQGHGFRARRPKNLLEDVLPCQGVENISIIQISSQDRTRPAHRGSSSNGRGLLSELPSPRRSTVFGARSSMCMDIWHMVF